MKKNDRGESPIDVVSGKWDDGLAKSYKAIGNGIDEELDLEHIQEERGRIAALLREHAGEGASSDKSGD